MQRNEIAGNAHPAVWKCSASKDFVNLPRTIVRFVFIAAMLLCMEAFSMLAMRAQTPTGPQTAPRGPDVIRIPATPQPDTPPIPPDEIIRRFAAQEDIFARAREGYTYRKSVRV